ncbi:MAG: threonine--tRNA ligase [Planctomycetota bacterium]|jgi:threonyl-tRNA synthetase
MPVSVILPDGSKKELPEGATGADLAKAIGPRLAKVAIACTVDGELWDFHRPLPDGAKVTIVKEDQPDGLWVLRHSASHVMAGAIKRIYGAKNVKLAIGPPVEDGFYYDIDATARVTDEDLAGIEAEMEKILAEDCPFERTEVPHDEALRRAKEEGEDYKVEMLSTDITDPKVSFYTDGDFTDLCEGPHVTSTGRIGAVKLLKVTGAYWRGDEKKKMLTRIYGTAFHTPEALAEHLKWMEEAKKRDHRRLGKDLDLFSIHPEVGGGLIHWHPKGAILCDIIEDLWKREHRKRGYELVSTPHIASEQIYHISGHLEAYSDLMYGALDVEGRPFRVKPMNCPGHIMIYKTRLHSYRELPIRYAEMGTCYRFEKGGVLHGLMRVRGFTIDDAHIFATPEGMEDEVINVFRFALDLLRMFGFEEFQVYLSTKPDKYVGPDEDWARAEASLESALKRENVAYELDPGGGAFYGPKIDIKVRDCLKRLWQFTTVQFDFNEPERFDITYVAEDSARKRPYMIHRALLGSLERFIGVLIEHYGGAFPLWLSPEQVRVISVTEKEEEYARKVRERLLEEGFRCEIDLANERVSYKIRGAQLQKVPYMAVVGKREAGAGTVSVRERKEGDLGAVSLEEFVDRLRQEVRHTTE